MLTMSGGELHSPIADSHWTGAGSPPSALTDQADRMLERYESLLYLLNYNMHCKGMQCKLEKLGAACGC